MGFTVWIDPLPEFVPREIALVFFPGYFLCMAPVCMSDMWISEI